MLLFAVQPKIYFAMKAEIIIHNIGQLLTCGANSEPKRGLAMRDLGLVEKAAVVVKNGFIFDIGETNDILEKYDSKQFLDAGNNVVMPGFVDPHTHIVYAGNRLDEFELKIKGADYLEILASGGGILSTVANTRRATKEELIRQTRERLDKMLHHGTTTAEIKTGYGLDTETEFKMLEVILELNELHPIEIVATFLAAHAIPPEFKDNSTAYTELICQEMLPQLAEIRKRRLEFERPFFVDVFCEKNAFDLEQTRRVLETAKDLGFGLKAHVDEFTNLGGSKLSIELGAASIDHLDAISTDEIALLADSDTIGIVTPTVNFNFGSTEYADARRLIDSGCAIAVSTDYNPGSAPCPSQQTAMQIACRYQKILPYEASTATTINAAFAVGLCAKTGTLEIGKQADLLVLATDDYREICYEFGGNFVARVIKNGKILDN